MSTIEKEKGLIRWRVTKILYHHDDRIDAKATYRRTTCGIAIYIINLLKTGDFNDEYHTLLIFLNGSKGNVLQDFPVILKQMLQNY